MNLLEIYHQALSIIEKKKIITTKIKEELIKLGFKEVILGTKKEHEISSKEVKVNFHSYDIAIGLSSSAISYSSGRRYKAMVYKEKNKKR